MSKRKPASPGFVLGLAIVCVLAGCFPFYSAWQARRLGSASEPSTCEILSKDVRVSESEDSADGYYPIIEIAHTVDGERYTREDSGKRFIAESEARAAIAHLVVGSKVGCRYVAGSPAAVVALEQDPGQFRGMLFFGVFLWLMPLGVFVWARRQPGWSGP